MSNRFRLNTSGAKISKPSFNVDTANRSGLLFDSSMASANIYLQGAVTLAANTNPATTRYFDVSFAKVIRPFLMCYVEADMGTTISSFVTTGRTVLWSGGVNYSGPNGNNAPDGNGVAVVCPLNWNAGGASTPEVWNYNYTERSGQLLQRTDRNHMRFWWYNLRSAACTFRYKIIDLGV